jgi:heme/copper-type cytochrome/quinol oxidase subunit 3
MRQRSPATIGVAVFLASEAMFFLFLIVAYVYLSGAAISGPTARTELDPRTTGLYTVALIASSATVWRAASRVRTKRPAGWWLLFTVVLGASFLVGQGREYARLVGERVTVGRNVFGTAFFTLTGFHGFHVLLGVVMLAVVAIVGRLDGDPPDAALEPVALYWHFVDVVWIVIFAVVYVRPFI